jgi:hypothetical protein
VAGDVMGSSGIGSVTSIEEAGRHEEACGAGRSGAATGWSSKKRIYF